MLKRIKNFFYNIISSNFGGNFIKLVSGTTIAQFLPIIVTPILTRIYSPESFGNLALLTSITGIIGVVVNGRYEFALSIEKRMDNIKQIFFLGLFINFSISIVVFTSLTFFNLANKNENSFTSLFFINYHIYIVIAIFLYGLNQNLNLYLNRINNFNAISIGKIIQGISIVFLWILLYKLEAKGLVIGWVSGYFIASFYLLLRAKIIMRPFNIIKIMELAIRYKRFPLIDSWSAILNSLSLQLPNFIIANFFGVYNTGQFSQSYRLMQLPTSFLGYSIGQVFLNEGANYIRTNKIEKVESLFYKIFHNLGFIGIIPFSIIFIFGKDIFDAILGVEWQMAGTIASAFSIWLFYAFASSHITYIFILFERQDINLKFNVLLFLFRIGALLLGIKYIHSFIEIMWIYGIGSFIVLLFAGAWGLKKLNLNYKKLILFPVIFAVSIHLIFILINGL